MPSGSCLHKNKNATHGSHKKIFFTLLLYPNEEHSCGKICVVIEEGPPKQLIDDPIVHNNENNFPAEFKKINNQ